MPTARKRQLPIPPPEEDAAGSAEFTPWLTISPDDIVTVRATAPDQGNGTLTMPASYIMEELGTRWDKIKVEFASTNRDYLEGGVYSKVGGVLGYFAGRSTGPDRMAVYLQVAASTRERLKAAAAQSWNVPADEVDAKDSLLTHKPTGRTLRFGEVLEAAASIQLDAEPKRGDFRLPIRAPAHIPRALPEPWDFFAGGEGDGGLHGMNLAQNGRIGQVRSRLRNAMDSRARSNRVR